MALSAFQGGANEDPFELRLGLIEKRTFGRHRPRIRPERKGPRPIGIRPCGRHRRRKLRRQILDAHFAPRGEHGNRAAGTPVSYTHLDVYKRQGGTLFLDEIGDMSTPLQTRLLRVLAEGEFYRVGGQTPIRVDVRVIAATHQNLQTRVERGLFREDLYHRLNVIRIELPPLRARAEDIPDLLEHYLRFATQELSLIHI